MLLILWHITQKINEEKIVLYFRMGTLQAPLSGFFFMVSKY
jgi:glutaredoxin-related protein